MKEQYFPGLPVTALTATATQSVQQDVLKSLKMKNLVRFNVSFFRENLILRVIPKEYDKDKQTMLCAWEQRLLQYVESKPNETGIIYCLSRDDTESISNMINSIAGVSAAHYHAGMTPGQRTNIQNKWREGSIKVVAATIAFGMGIDHPNVRYVIHATMSKSLEGYYQEAGRCGRDGQKGECVLFYGKRDGPRILNLIRKGKKKGSSLQRQYALFNSVTEYCCNASMCRHAQLLSYLGEHWSQNSCGLSCDVCRNEVVRIMDKEKQQARGTKSNGRKRAKKSKEARPLPGFTSAAQALKSSFK